MEHIFKESYSRKCDSLNGSWEFCIDKNNIGKDDKWYLNFPEKIRYINVPGCWNFELDLFDYFGTSWYKKEFYSKECNLQIEFGAVSGLCEVYLDGEYLGSHYGGWSAFKFIKKVSSGKHCLIVRVDASSNTTNTIPLQEVDWYHYGGIMRSVVITEFTKPFIENYRIAYELDEKLKNATLDISLSFNILNGSNYKTVANIFLNDEKVFSDSINLSEENTAEIKNLKVKNIKLWGVGEPNLYTLRVETEDDDIIEQIGFRKIEIKGDKFYLNGEQIIFKGVNRHEEHPDWGFAMPANLQKRDLDIIKDLGCNIVRGSHYPNSHTFLDYLDREGILFWSEIPMWGFTPKALADPLTLERGIAMHSEMIEQYYHHPSIVIWGLHNEIATDSREGYELTKAFNEFVRGKDNSRLITYATCRYHKDICLEFTDFISLNYYMGWYSGSFDDWDKFFEDIPKIAEEHNAAGKPVVMSEFGCAAIFGYDNFSHDKWTMEYQSQMIEKIIRLSQERNIGTLVWQFADIKSDININRARSFNNKGILDEYRRPKMSYYTVKKLYN